MSDKPLNLTVYVWRQKDAKDAGGLVKYDVKGVSSHASFLEMLDILNEQLIERGEEPVAFDADCREGICGMCSLVINGRPHGGFAGTTTCQVHMRHFKDGETIYIEPWRASSFPVVKDLVVDRSAFESIMQAGGFITNNCGSAGDANAIPVPKEQADRAFEAAACIGCGACVASCPNAAAQLFMGAKISHLGLLPQGQAERESRVLGMVTQAESEGFGHCSNHAECEASCPKEITIENIARMNRDYLKASITSRNPPTEAPIKKTA